MACFLLTSWQSQQVELAALVETRAGHTQPRAEELRATKPWADICPPQAPPPARHHSTPSYQLEFWAPAINQHREKCLTPEPLGGLGVVVSPWSLGEITEIIKLCIYPFAMLEH